MRIPIISETIWLAFFLDIYENKPDGNQKAMEHPIFWLLHDESSSKIRT
jgi:hypothetical protein